METTYKVEVDGSPALMRPYNSPMEAMEQVAAYFTIVGGYGSTGRVECFRYQNDEKLERQWLITID